MVPGSISSRPSSARWPKPSCGTFAFSHGPNFGREFFRGSQRSTLRQSSTAGTSSPPSIRKYFSETLYRLVLWAHFKDHAERDAAVVLPGRDSRRRRWRRTKQTHILRAGKVAGKI